MGDSMIFLSVLILGKRDGAFAGALGGALADLLCGAAIWIGPTLIIKFIMAWIMGIIWEQYPSKIISAIAVSYTHLFMSNKIIISFLHLKILRSSYFNILITAYYNFDWSCTKLFNQ